MHNRNKTRAVWAHCTELASSGAPIKIRAVSESLGISLGSARHHLENLERLGYMKRVKRRDGARTQWAVEIPILTIGS